MRYVIGLDGGGSKTEGIIVDESGRILSRKTGGPSNLNSLEKSKVRKNLQQLLDNLICSAKITVTDISITVGGFAGAGSSQNKYTLKTILEDAGLKNTSILTDLEIAVEAAFPQREGIVVNSGTGSFAAGRGVEGKTLRSGGYGYLLGDEGSGFNIGLKAIASALKSRDGIISETELADRICGALNLSSIEEAIPLVYSEDIDNTVIAGLAPLVMKSAENGDEAAGTIVAEAAGYFVKIIRNLLIKIKISKYPVNTCFTGSVFLGNEFLIERIGIELRGKINIVPAEYPPVTGSVILAFMELNIGISEKICMNLKETAGSN